MMHLQCTCDAHVPAMPVRDFVFACVQYRWETAEQDAVERRVAELDKVT